MVDTALCAFAHHEAPRAGHHQPRRTSVKAARLCRACLSTTRRGLAALPGLYAECAEHNPLHDKGDLREKVRSSREATLPLPEAAVHARAEIRGVLASWSGLVVAELGPVGAPSRTVPAMTQFLIRNLNWLATHPAAADFAAEIAELTAQAARALDPGQKKRPPLGTCTETGCDALLYADQAARRIVCESGHESRYDQWLLLGRKLERSAR
jgi:hypothetical protein